MIKEKISELTGKKNVFLTKSGDHSIKYILKLVKSLNKKVLLQDQGGWITYQQFCKKFNIEFEELLTDFGIIDPKYLDQHKEYVLLANSMPGYHALQNMKKLLEECQKNQILLVNDASGSIGTQQAMFGDIIFGSFGKNKPINLEDGGFIATDSSEYLDFFKKKYEEYKIDSTKFEKEAEKLSAKLKKWKNTRQKIIKDLEDLRIIHPYHDGINVIVAFSNDKEREKLINYCKQNNYEFRECPMQIRVLEKAISIEIKRIQK